MRGHNAPRCLLTLAMAVGISLTLATCAVGPPVAESPAPSATPDAPAGTSTPLRIPTIAPTATWPPSSTPIATRPPATPTSTVTATPTLSPTATSTATPTAPAPTPEPSALLALAVRHQVNGQYEQAVLAYQGVLDGSPAPEEERQARYHLAECHSLDQDAAAAAAAWEDFLARYPEDDLLPPALLMAAQAYQVSGACPRAIALYQAYLGRETTLADLALSRIGDCQAAEGQRPVAIESFRQALAATSDKVAQIGLRVKIADAYLALADYGTALAETEVLLSLAQSNADRARFEYRAGQALAASGQVEAAQARYRRAVDQYPSAEFAYLALIELVEAGVEVDEFQRGLVDYYAGAIYPDAYGAAIDAFERYLGSLPAPRADEALYYQALAQRAAEQLDAALETLDALIEGYPQSRLLAQAWFEKGATLVRAADYDRAEEAYRHVATFFPADKLAPQALWQAAVARDRQGAFAAAAQLYTEVAARFPAFEDADEARWRAGLAHYRADDAAQAIASWQALLAEHPQSAFTAKCYYWLGKLGVTPAAGAGYWDRLLAAYPGQHYALRVEQVRSGESITASRLITTAVEPSPWNAAQAQQELLSWLQGWAPAPLPTAGPAAEPGGTAMAERSPANLPAALSSQGAFRRGEALLAAGLRREALSAFDAVRATAWDDPIGLAHLSLYFTDRGLYGMAARCGARLLSLWGAASAAPKGVAEAPPVLQRIVYPLPFAELVSAEAQQHGLDPLLLAALIRQESLFEPAAESYAGARGLGQVMPATGEGIARSLGLDDFVLDDLYRPAVSIRFGAYYLAVQMKRFDNQILIALAAYNGGPGNTLRWLEGSGDDLDLFVEAITADQSRIYLQRVFEQYLRYEQIYRPAG